MDANYKKCKYCNLKATRVISDEDVCEDHKYKKRPTFNPDISAFSWAEIERSWGDITAFRVTSTNTSGSYVVGPLIA